VGLDELHANVLKPCVRVRTRRAGGSGTVIYSAEAEDGWSTYVLTNHHVVEDAIRVVEKWDPILQRNAKRDERDLVEVHFFNYRWTSRAVGANAIEAEIMAYDKDEDLALLKLRGTDPVPAVATLFPRGEESHLRVGAPIYTVGCGLGEPPILTDGFVSVFGREIDGREYWIVTSPAIYGNSGGGTFLSDGRFIGVPSRIAVTGVLGQTAVTHLAYITPITRVYGFLEAQRYRFIYDASHTEASEAEERERLRQADKAQIKAREERE
jgi:S1-C subfamily serine protease